MGWFTELVNQAMEAVNTGSPLALGALALVAALTEIGVPFPFVIDAVLLYVGFGTADLFVRALPIMLALFLGRVAGAGFIYGLSRVVGNPFLNWLSRRGPRISSTLGGLKRRLGALPGRAECSVPAGGVSGFWANLRRSLHVPVAVCIARLTPGLLTGVTVAAGAIGMHFGFFVLGILFASLAADGALIVSGLLAGLGIQFLGVTPSPWVFAILLVIFLVLAWLIPKKIMKHRSKRKTIQ